MHEIEESFLKTHSTFCLTLCSFSNPWNNVALLNNFYTACTNGYNNQKSQDSAIPKNYIKMIDVLLGLSI